MRREVLVIAVLGCVTISAGAAAQESPADGYLRARVRAPQRAQEMSTPRGALLLQGPPP